MRTVRHSWRLAGLGIVLLSLGAVGTASAQQPAALDSATLAAIAPIVAQARSARLPLDPLYARAREGQLRKVPVPTIEAAVRALAERMQTANEALAPNPSEQELRAAADAIKVGIPVETLRAMRKAGKDGSLAVPLGVLTQLVARGVPVEKASMQIVDLLQRGAVPRNFIALEESVRQDVLAGRRPDESLDLRLKGIIPNLPQQATADGLTATSGPKRPR
jgi:hypothetical protein